MGFAWGTGKGSQNPSRILTIEGVCYFFLQYFTHTGSTLCEYFGGILNSPQYTNINPKIVHFLSILVTHHHQLIIGIIGVWYVLKHRIRPSKYIDKAMHAKSKRKLREIGCLKAIIISVRWLALQGYVFLKSWWISIFFWIARIWFKWWML